MRPALWCGRPMTIPDEPQEPRAEQPAPEAEAAAPPPGGAEPDSEAPDPAEPPAAKTGLWSRMQKTAQKIASATKDAASKVGHVTSEIARETVNVARDGAHETSEMAKHTVSHFDEVRQQTGAAFAKVGKSVSDTTIGIAQSASKTIAVASTEAVKALVNNMNEALPYIERAGYKVSEIELGISIPPKVVLHLTLGPELSDEVREALLKDCEGKWFTRQLIERLHNVRQIQRATQFVGMAFDEIEVELAMIPQVLLHYRKKYINRPLEAETPLADAAAAREEIAQAASGEPVPEVAVDKVEEIEVEQQKEVD
ncbi:hypothetical protein sos41_37910 [Alphaproteobacteria bacterium SO-S41]|nr:hypothetical protein sos41_37910 [Alphaproteobacteria bacterium SO-S41]